METKDDKVFVEAIVSLLNEQENSNEISAYVGFIIETTMDQLCW